ncbi:DinB family protein [Streptomyces sp. NPDC001070]
MESAEPDWNAQLTDQLDWHWRNQLRPRLEGLTDDEYFWEPVPGCWSVRPHGSGRAPIEAGTGDFRLDFAWPPQEPGPVTTIAWRLGHIITGVLGLRVASHFGGPPVDFAGRDFAFAGTADGALAQLDATYAAWRDGVRGLGAEGLARPCGPEEGPFAKEPLAALVLHINREVIHHGAEIALLRDLYRDRQGGPGEGTLPD